MRAIFGGWSVVLLAIWSPAFAAIDSGAHLAAWLEHMQAAQRFCSEGKYSAARGSLTAALRKAEGFPKGDWRLPRTLTFSGWVEQQLGHYRAAEKAYKKSIYQLQKHQGDEASLVTALRVLMSLYLETNELKSALNIDALLACSAARLSLPATEKAGILNNRAVLLCRRRKYLEAESVLREALTLWGGEPGAVAALNSLCLVCVRTGRTIEALNYAEAAVRAGERTLARSHPMLVRPLANLASLHQMAGQDGEAELAFRRALAIAESISGPDHPLVVSVLRERALSLRKAGRPALAQPLKKRAETLDANWRRAGKAEYTVDVSEYAVDLGTPHQR